MPTVTDYDREPLKIIADILKQQLQLSDDQIMLAYQKFDISSSKKLYIALSVLSGKAIGNNNVYDATAEQELQQVTMHEIIQIDMMSFDSSARVRKEEVLAALRGVYSQQQQGKYGFQIARVPGDFVNVSSLEETQYLNRFTITVAVTSARTFIQHPDYFDTFEDADVVVNQ